jgi:hypothetical protein
VTIGVSSSVEARQGHQDRVLSGLLLVSNMLISESSVDCSGDRNPTSFPRGEVSYE